MSLLALKCINTARSSTLFAASNLVLVHPSIHPSIHIPQNTVDLCSYHKSTPQKTQPTRRSFFLALIRTRSTYCTMPSQFMRIYQITLLVVLLQLVAESTSFTCSDGKNTSGLCLMKRRKGVRSKFFYIWVQCPWSS